MNKHQELCDKLGYQIPESVIDRVANIGIRGFFASALKWSDTQLEILRETLPPEYQDIPAETLRKLCARCKKKAGPKTYEAIESQDDPSVVEWLESKEYKALARAWVKAAGGRCQLCNNGKDVGHPLHVHHRTFETIKTSREQEDTVVLCKPCHGWIHSLLHRNYLDTIL
jgi:hypothetical protein